MTPNEAAKVIGCHKRHVRHLITTGKLKATRRQLPGGGYYYNLKPSDVKRYAKTKQTRGYPRGKKR